MKNNPYMIQLDALRAFAVFAVLLGHALPESSLWNKMGIGFLGVRLFFVLSGFLITGILLNSRKHLRDPGQTSLSILRTFYIRRFLRIFPVYYLLLFLYAGLGLEVLKDTFAWHFFYLSNYYMAFQGAWLPPISHLWSLLRNVHGNSVQAKTPWRSILKVRSM